MTRRSEDSDEERHDRFRSERSTTSLKPLTGLGSKRISTNLSRQNDRRIRNRRSSPEREMSGSRRSRERSLVRKRRNSEERTSHKRRSSSKEREDRKKKKHKDRRSPSREMSKSNWRSRSSSDRKSDSYSSQDSRTDRKSSKHSRRNRDRDCHTAISRVDTFSHKFERRRDSSVEEEVVDNNVVYRDSSASPEPSKHKKKKNGEKEKKKERRKEKKKKKKSRSIDKSEEPLISSTVVITPEKVTTNNCDRSGNNSPSIEDNTLLVKEDSSLDVYGPVMPPKTDQKLVGPVVPSSSPEESLPGNRSTLRESSPQPEKDVCKSEAPTNSNRISTGEETDPAKDPSPAEPEPITASLGEGEAVDQKEIGRVYGPVLPQRAPATEVCEDDSSSYGPALPPRLLKPQLPAEQEDEDDDGGYGPLPAGLGGRTQEELEIRAALIKRQLGNKETDDRPKKREEWMIELPDARRAEFGLGPRKFRAREAPDMSDRSSWTDTPEEKKKREELSRLGVVTKDDEDDNTSSKLLGIIARDKEMEKKAREKKKDKSLLDIHQKELKKKRKKEEKERRGEQEERRPFSRELDLQTNRFDEAQKKSIIKKAQLLDSRFSRGETKYL